MAKTKKDSGRKREFYGYQVLTSELAAGDWLVHVYVKRPGDTIEKDGFRFEGEALDWAQDWCHQHRNLSYKVKNTDDGAVAFILDHDGREMQRLGAQPAPHAAELLAQKYIEAIRVHDLDLIEERRKNRANFRMEMQELDEREAFFEKQVADAKEAMKKLDAKRDDLKSGLHAPQVEFNFTMTSPSDDRQLDLDEPEGKRRSPRGTLRSITGNASETSTGGAG